MSSQFYDIAVEFAEVFVGVTTSVLGKIFVACAMPSMEDDVLTIAVEAFVAFPEVGEVAGGLTATGLNSG